MYNTLVEAFVQELDKLAGTWELASGKAYSNPAYFGPKKKKGSKKPALKKLAGPDKKYWKGRRKAATVGGLVGGAGGAGPAAAGAAIGAHPGRKLRSAAGAGVGSFAGHATGYLSGRGAGLGHKASATLGAGLGAAGGAGGAYLAHGKYPGGKKVKWRKANK